MKQHTSTSRVWQRRAIAIAASMLALATAGINTAYAQSSVTGTIYGTVPAGSGVTVVIENTATGLKRTLTPDANGRFSATALPPGNYQATQLRNGQPTGAPSTVEVLLGQGVEAVFAGGSQVVTVTGSARRLDMSATTNGATFTAKQLDALPIAHTLDAIIQLAPNTTKADPRYSGGASIGGGAPSENSYYVNGFPVTNALNQLGSLELPFGAIAQVNVSSGGFGAEFGRSVGGVLNIVTKTGGNSWEAGVSAGITPRKLRSTYNDINYPMGTGNATDGKVYFNNQDRKRQEYTYGAYIGGPIIQDKLFVFLAVERAGDDLQRQNVSAASFPASGFLNSGWAERKNVNDRYLAKFDWNLTKNHVLEFTALGDTYTQDETLTGYNYLTGVRDGIVKAQANFVNQADHNTGVGGKAQILKYTGFLTDDLTISALYGRSESPHKNTYAGVDVYSQVRQVRADTTTRFPGFTYNNPYPFAAGTLVLAPGSKDQVDAMRFDLEYKLGDHLLRAGIDKVDLKSTNAGDVLAGNGLYRYFRTTNAGLKPNVATTAVGAGAGVLTSPNPAGTTPANSTFYYYGYEQIFSTTTNAESNQSAFYLEDKWQVNKQLLITPGVRIEKYANLNGDGQTFLSVKTQLHPRLQFSYDVFGDAGTKLYGSAGRYGVQIPTHLAVRGASRSTFTRQPFVYTGVDANGVPTGRANLGAPNSSNNEYGQAKDANTVAAQDMKPNSQDELTLGIERALSNKINVGAKATFRTLVATIDDLCDPRPFEAFAVKNNIDATKYAGFGCASFNPGQDNTFLVDYAANGTYTKVNLSKADLGFEKAKRTYFALDFFAEHAFSDGWYGKVTYTYAKSKGNTEGQTLSDVAQTDVAATQTWDHPELMHGADGYLPNDRRHQIKAHGFINVTPEIAVGASALMASGRPKNCIGNFGGTPFAPAGATTTFSDVDYGSSYRYCSFDGVTQVYTPRGSEGTLPWEYRLDMNLAYRPAFAKGLQLRVDVFNMFNRQSAQAIDEVHENASDITSVLPTYGRVISYTAPRAVKFTATYDYKF